MNFIVDKEAYNTLKLDYPKVNFKERVKVHLSTNEVLFGQCWGCN